MVGRLIGQCVRKAVGWKRGVSLEGAPTGGAAFLRVRGTNKDQRLLTCVGARKPEHESQSNQFVCGARQGERGLTRPVEQEGLTNACTHNIWPPVFLLV